MLLNLNLRDDILENFPNYEYFNSKNSKLLDYTVENNLVGQQQESFVLYWLLKQAREHGGVGLDIGCGQDPHIFSIGINNYHGNCHPLYGGKYNCHITSLAENITVLNEETFSWVIASHILEHVNDPIITFRKWCKLLKRKNGIMILVMPDKTYERSLWDPTHKNFYSPDDFKRLIIDSNLDLMVTEELDTFHNKFSFNYVGRRI